MNKPSVVLMYDHFYPDYKAGGPVTSLANLARLISTDASIKIIAGATEYGSGVVMNIPTNQWTEWNDIPIWYATNRKSIAEALASIPRGSFLYVNGLFSFSYFIFSVWQAKRISMRVVVSPRGMLQMGALKQSYLKKQVYLNLLKRFGFFKNVTWHATDEQEASDIKAYFGDANGVKIIPNVPRMVSLEIPEIEKKPRQLRLVYFSLIARKKNLLFFLELLCLKEFENIELDIIGPIKDEGYWQECLKLIVNIPHQERVVYKGEINPIDIEKTLGCYHALVLPTLGENFGHAIVEMLACSRPVVISDKTPWNDVEKNGAGFALELDKEKWENALTAMLEWDQKEFDKACESAVNYYQSKFNFDDLKMRYLNLFSIPS